MWVVTGNRLIFLAVGALRNLTQPGRIPTYDSVHCWSSWDDVWGYSMDKGRVLCIPWNIQSKIPWIYLNWINLRQIAENAWFSSVMDFQGIFITVCSSALDTCLVLELLASEFYLFVARASIMWPEVFAQERSTKREQISQRWTSGGKFENDLIPIITSAGICVMNYIMIHYSHSLDEGQSGSYCGWDWRVLQKTTFSSISSGRQSWRYTLSADQPKQFSLDYADPRSWTKKPAYTLLVVLGDLFKHRREQIANTRFTLVPTWEECLLTRVQTFTMAFL